MVKRILKWIAMVIAVGALTLHLRALHRALCQHARVAYKAFMLDFFLATKSLMRERESGEDTAAGELVWNLVEDYLRQEAEPYNAVVEELYDKPAYARSGSSGRSGGRGATGAPSSP